MDEVRYVEMDPSARYGRLGEILGRGAMKTVYKAFDEVLGMEVAWSQVMLNDALRTPEELPRLYSEVHLLKTLNHESIIRCYSYWINTERRTFNFITEMLTSGTLREYRQKFKEVDIRAIKNWARQILRGLAYLHSHDDPVIHRDLKGDNIFVNGHLGQVKIGDFGLAVILRGSRNAHSLLGTPEFMAPEVYNEKYNELVDVYSFGMCILEIITSEYPYSECSSAPEIRDKVLAGKKPRGFYRIHDAEAQRFVAKCLENVSTRPPARELLLDPFLAYDNDPMPAHGAPLRRYSSNDDMLFLFSNCIKSTYMTITGTVNAEDNTLSLRVRIYDKDVMLQGCGHVENLDFPFDITKDTSMDVAMEMIKEMGIITDWDPREIADMIEEELSSLVPGWETMNSLQNLQQHTQYSGDNNNEIRTPHDSFANYRERCEEQQLSQNTNQGHLLPDSEKSPENSENALTESPYSNCSYFENEYPLERDESKNERLSGSNSQKDKTTKGKEKRNGLSDTLKDLGSTSGRMLGRIRNPFQRTRVNKTLTEKTVANVENTGRAKVNRV